MQTNQGIFKNSRFISGCPNLFSLRGLQDKIFFQWKHMGIVTIQDLYREGTISSFEQLKQYYALVPANFFSYL